MGNGYICETTASNLHSSESTVQPDPTLTTPEHYQVRLKTFCHFVDSYFDERQESWTLALTRQPFSVIIVPSEHIARTECVSARKDIQVTESNVFTIAQTNTFGVVKHAYRLCPKSMKV